MLAGVELRGERGGWTEEDGDLEDESHRDVAHAGPVPDDDATLAGQRRPGGEDGVEAGARAGSDDAPAARGDRKANADETTTDRLGHGEGGEI